MVVSGLLGFSGLGRFEDLGFFAARLFWIFLGGLEAGLEFQGFGVSGPKPLHPEPRFLEFSV